MYSALTFTFGNLMESALSINPRFWAILPT